MRTKAAPSRESIPGRWKVAAAQAAQRTLAARWRSTAEALDAARVEYQALHSSANVDVRALRKAAQRIHDLEQLRSVLSRELSDQRGGTGFEQLKP